MEDLNAALPEGLPSGMLKEFEDTKRCALLIRQSFLDLRDNFRRIVDPPTWSSSSKGVILFLNPKPQIIFTLCVYIIKHCFSCYFSITF